MKESFEAESEVNTMQMIKFVSKRKEENCFICWCTTNTLKGFRDFMQYMLDNIKNAEEFMIIDIEKDLVYDAYRVATEMYGMRKRTLEERLQGVQTGKWKDVELK